MIKVGIRQGPSLRPYLFSSVMDEPTKSVYEEAPLFMIFADYVVLVEASINASEGKLDR